MISVADAGPLIHLAEVGQLTLLSVFETVLVPGAVWDETVGRGRLTESQIHRVGVLHRRGVNTPRVGRFVIDHGLERLHYGEREALLLAVDEGIALLLTDDLAVRRASRSLNLRPVGSLGVVIRAAMEGLVSVAEAEELLRRLHRESSLFVTEAIVDLALEQLTALTPKPGPRES